MRRGPLQKKLDALKASTHIDEEFNAVMNVNDNSNDSDSNQTLNTSLKGSSASYWTHLSRDPNMSYFRDGYR